MATGRIHPRPGAGPLEIRATDTGRRLPGLDGLRGLAVLLVLIFHIVQVEPEPASGLARLAYRATRVGQTGVDLFFVLSGFLITGILSDARGSIRYFRNFYGRRTLRIFPLYYGVLIAATVILPMLLGHRLTDASPLTLWTFTANLPGTFGAEPATFGHFWTLAIEEQFYLIWPAVVLAFARPTLMRICVGCVFGSILVRASLVSLDLSANFFLLGRLDSLALGGWLALAARGPDGVRGWRTRAWMILGAMAVAVAPLYVAKSGSHEAWLQVTKYTLLAGLFAALLALVLVSDGGSLVGRIFNGRLLRFFGQYSYGIYVGHPFLIDAFRGCPGGLAVRGVGIATTSVAAAWLSWHLYEKHFLKLRNFFDDGPGRGLAELDEIGTASHMMRGGRALGVEG